MSHKPRVATEAIWWGATADRGMEWIWSQASKRLLWRQVWLALATAQADAGILADESLLKELRENVKNIDLSRAAEIEKETGHDLMAELRVYAEQSGAAGAIIHLGATSMDIEDNADIVRIRTSLTIIEDKLTDLLVAFCRRIRDTADVATLGFTHMQAAEPTTVGYRLAQYAQDLLSDYHLISRTRQELRAKGPRGAVGNSASYVELLRERGAGRWPEQEVRDRLKMFEDSFLGKLGLRSFIVATQTYPRKQDWNVMNALAGIAGSLSRFASDLRLLQAFGIEEWWEPAERKQVSSSAMPGKRNPVRAERIISKARYLSKLCAVAWDNSVMTALERTLDDAWCREKMLSEAFILTEEMLGTVSGLVEGLSFSWERISANLRCAASYAVLERVLLKGAATGQDRQHLHEQLRSLAAELQARVLAGEDVDRLESLRAAEGLGCFFSDELLDMTSYVGQAASWARATADAVEAALKGGRP